MDDGSEVKASLARFGAHLRTARLRRGLSQAGVAAMAGVSLRTLQKLESGDPGVAIRTVASVMKVLGFGLPFGTLCAPEGDEEGRRHDEARVPKRGRGIRRDSAEAVTA
nr:helix-turn-helix domain-containing protein [Desulfovibrio sp.]